MTSLPVSIPDVLDEYRLSNSFLGNVIEICIVTADYRKTIEGLIRLGIGPWRVYTFSSSNVQDQTYRGAESEFSLKVAFAINDNITWELMQPIEGRSIMAEFLEKHGEGIHHVAFDCNGAPWEERIKMFAERGFEKTQSGLWADGNSFAFFDTEAATTTCFETYHFPPDFEYPEPEEWLPAPPPR